MDFSTATVDQLTRLNRKKLAELMVIPCLDDCKADREIVKMKTSVKCHKRVYTSLYGYVSRRKLWGDIGNTRLHWALMKL